MNDKRFYGWNGRYIVSLRSVHAIASHVNSILYIRDSRVSEIEYALS